MKEGFHSRRRRLINETLERRVHRSRVRDVNEERKAFDLSVAIKALPPPPHESSERWASYRFLSTQRVPAYHRQVEETSEGERATRQG